MQCKADIRLVDAHAEGVRARQHLKLIALELGCRSALKLRPLFFASPLGRLSGMGRHREVGNSPSNSIRHINGAVGAIDVRAEHQTGDWRFATSAPERLCIPDAEALVEADEHLVELSTFIPRGAWDDFEP